MPFKTEENISNVYKETELKDEKWWISYLRIREDLNVTRTNILRTGEAINDLERLIKEFYTATDENFDNVNTKIETIDRNINKNAEKLVEIAGELTTKLDINQQALLNATMAINANIDKNKDMLGKAYTGLSTKIAETNTKIAETNTNISDEIKSSKSEINAEISSQVNRSENAVIAKIESSDTSIADLMNKLNQKIDENILKLNADIKKKWWWIIGVIGGSFLIIAALINLYKFVIK